MIDPKTVDERAQQAVDAMLERFLSVPVAVHLRFAIVCFLMSAAICFNFALAGMLLDGLNFTGTSRIVSLQWPCVMAFAVWYARVVYFSGKGE